MKTGNKNRSRMFFAVWPNSETLAALQDIQSRVTAKGAKAVRIENLHMTLSFMGSVDKQTEQCFIAAAAGLDAQPCVVELNSFGYFARPGLCWIGPDKVPDTLLNMRNKLHQKLRSCKPVRNSTFKPHITLFRKASVCRVPENFSAIKFPVTSFILAASQLKPGGVHYLKLQEFPL